MDNDKPACLVSQNWRLMCASIGGASVNVLSIFLKHRFLFTLGVIVVYSLVSCNTVENPPDTSPLPTPLAIPYPSVAVSSPSSMVSPSLLPSDISLITPDVLINPEQSGQIIQISIGQLIMVANPSLSAEWQVNYAPEVLEMVTPTERSQAPGTEGWRFRAIATGQTDLVLMSIVQPCTNNTPCPPMSARFVFTIQVN